MDHNSMDQLPYGLRHELLDAYGTWVYRRLTSCVLSEQSHWETEKGSNGMTSAPSTDG